MINIAFDTSTLLDQADAIGRLDGPTLAKLGRGVVNVVALRVREKSIDETVADLNLSRDYVESRIARDEAKGALARARLTSHVRGTTLQRFGATQATRAVNWSNSRIESLGHEFGKWPGWTYRRGDESRGIPENAKAAGVSVDVNRKGAKTIKTAFTMPLKNGNGTGTFRRENGALKHLYGPSVYQVFRRYITTNEQTISDTLQDEYMEQLDATLQEVFK